MLLQNVVDFLLSDVSAHPLHGKLYVLAVNIARVVCIELLEDGAHFGAGFLPREEFSYVKCSSKELTIVDLTITTAVNLFNNFVYFFFR